MNHRKLFAILLKLIRQLKEFVFIAHPNGMLFLNDNATSSSPGLTACRNTWNSQLLLSAFAGVSPAHEERFFCKLRSNESGVPEIFQRN